LTSAGLDYADVRTARDYNLERDLLPGGRRPVLLNA
jgi:hypothetical protein